MKKGGGKNKGTSFERMIAKQLSTWFTEGERDDTIWRTSISGGRATVRSRIGKKTAGGHGDLTFTDPIVKPLFDHVVIECKSGYGRWGVLDLIDKPKRAAIQQIEQWIEQANRERKEAAVPVAWIIAKRDKRDPVIFMPLAFANDLIEWYGRHDMDVCNGVGNCFGWGLRFYTPAKEQWMCLRLDYFLEWCSPAYFTDVVAEPPRRHGRRR